MDHSGDHPRRSAPQNQPQLRQPLQILPHAYSAPPGQHTKSAPTGTEMFPCIQGSISFSKCFWEVVPSALGSRSVFPRGFPASRLPPLCTRSHTCTRPLLDGFAVRRLHPVPNTLSTVELKRIVGGTLTPP